MIKAIILAITTFITSFFTKPNLSISPSPTPTVTPSESRITESEINGYIYPGAKVISSSDSNLDLTSYDDPNKILLWYSNKFSKGFSTNNVTNNNINGDVDAKIEVSNGSKSIKVMLIKNSSELYTHISVSIKS